MFSDFWGQLKCNLFLNVYWLHFWWSFPIWINLAIMDKFKQSLALKVKGHICLSHFVFSSHMDLSYTFYIFWLSKLLLWFFLKKIKFFLVPRFFHTPYSHYFLILLDKYQWSVSRSKSESCILSWSTCGPDDLLPGNTSPENSSVTEIYIVVFIWFKLASPVGFLG